MSIGRRPGVRMTLVALFAFPELRAALQDLYGRSS